MFFEIIWWQRAINKIYYVQELRNQRKEEIRKRIENINKKEVGITRNISV